MQVKGHCSLAANEFATKALYIKYSQKITCLSEKYCMLICQVAHGWRFIIIITIILSEDIRNKQQHNSLLMITDIQIML